MWIFYPSHFRLPNLSHLPLSPFFPAPFSQPLLRVGYSVGRLLLASKVNKGSLRLWPCFDSTGSTGRMGQHGRKRQQLRSESSPFGPNLNITAFDESSASKNIFQFSPFFISFWEKNLFIHIPGKSHSTSTSRKLQHVQRTYRAFQTLLT